MSWLWLALAIKQRKRARARRQNRITVAGSYLPDPAVIARLYSSGQIPPPPPRRRDR